MGYHPQGLVEAWGYHAEGFVEERIDLHDRVPWVSYMASRRRRRRASLMASRRRRLSEICSKTRDQNARSELLSALNQLLDITEKVAKVDLSLAEIRVQRALAARSNLRYWWVGILFVLILVGRYLFGGVEGEIEAIVCVLAARFLLNPEMERDCEARILSAQDRADTVRWRLDEFGKSRDALWDSTFENDAEGKPGS